MDLGEQLRDLQKMANEHREVLETEEAAKNALVMPFIRALGYNVFNPFEVKPEFTADVGVKKGEKVDYAIDDDHALRHDPVRPWPTFQDASATELHHEGGSAIVEHSRAKTRKGRSDETMPPPSAMSET